MKLRNYCATFVLINLLSFSGLASISANSSVNAGSSCSKIGIKTVVGASTFICSKSGKKLLWGKEQKTSKDNGENLVLTTPAYVPIPPKGGSDEYRCFLLDPTIVNDKYLKSVTIEPDNMLVSHHGILYRITAADIAATKNLDNQSMAPGWPCFGDTGIPSATAFTPASPSSWITFWAPGGNFKSYPAGTGMKISAGDQFVLQSHFMVQPGYTDAQNRASMKVTLAYASTPVAELKTMLVAAPIEIPCGVNESGPLCNRDAALADLVNRTSEKAALQETGLLFICGKNPGKPTPSSISECGQRIYSNITIYGATPHMHQLGKSISITLMRGVSKATTVLSTRPQWNFDNQRTDWLTTPVTAQAGDTVSVSCSYDVELRHLLPFYRDLSPNYIVWGEGTRDEMCLAILNYTN